MKKTKLSLSDLKVSSFVTDSKTVKGGTYLPQTYNCPILTADGCNQSWDDGCKSALVICYEPIEPIEPIFRTVDCSQLYLC